MEEYDTIVVGGGHAGIEASLAAARMGCRTLLITMNVDTIGHMSCNPSIGGIGKGHLVREIDALGGEMAKITDRTAIQIRMLNTRNGTAVRSPRAQCDKRAYQLAMKHTLESQPRLSIRQSKLIAIRHCADGTWEVMTDLKIGFSSRAIVLTTGTFLQGVMHLGESKLTGGRMGESASVDLSRSLIGLGLELDRLKTGTPPRLHRRSINWSECDCQPGDVPIPFFSHETPPTFHVEQHPCYLTHTTQKTSEVIMRNLDRSPMFTGKISGIGPRYCPSIEDKIVRFSNKESHQIYLEPEGVSTNEIYVNGASTSLPFDVQMDVIHSIRGLENAELIRPAYAVEYDYCPPTQLHPWLESKHSTGLFLAGQINGTSGYEEAAAQGIVAGINAALMVHGGPRFVMRRDQSYIGVMIDDLVTKGVPEPYRIFTSRAEYRLHLRFDNADLRLSRYGYEFGLISVARYRSICKMALAIDECMQTLRNVKSDGKRLADLLKIPDTDPSDIIHLVPHTDPVVLDHAATLVKYEGYLEREIRDASKYASMESEVIPSTIEYSQVHGLRTEAKSKLEKIRPYTIGQASRIAGVTPADIAVLSVWLRR